MGSFKFVNRQLEQWSLEFDKEREVECLLDRIKAHFSSTHPSITAQQRKKHKEELLRQKGMGGANGQIPDHLLEVQSIALLPCIPQHDAVGVTLYVDDAGSFKQLSVNTRATDIAQSCGMLSTCVLGDAFVGRVKENDEEFERRDFLVAELSSGAPWMHDARTYHAKKMNQPAAEDVLKDIRSKKKPQIIEITPAEEARQNGNEAYRKGNYEEAVKAYGVCLEHDPEAALAYSNRSMAHLQLKSFQSALDDAEAALKLDSTSIKACYRRGIALMSLGRIDEAKEEFTKILERQPSNTAASEKLKELQSSNS